MQPSFRMKSSKLRKANPIKIFCCVLLSSCVFSYKNCYLLTYQTVLVIVGMRINNELTTPFNYLLVIVFSTFNFPLQSLIGRIIK